MIYAKGVSKPFPTVGVIGAGHLSRMSIAPATELGINVLLLGAEHKDLQSIRDFASQCDVLTFEPKSIPLSIIKSLEAEGLAIRPSSAVLEKLTSGNISQFDFEICVMVARSPHGQTTSWAPTQVIEKNGSVLTITPAPNISAALSEKAQKVAIEIAAEVGVVGVISVAICVIEEELSVKEVNIGLNDAGNWSIEGAVTSQFEQHMRAVLDLPLGDPSMTTQFVVTGKVIAGAKPDMYRPYLHLMARNPGLKFHQYKNEASQGQQVGHITLLGHDLEFLQSEIEHALDYFNGSIDE